MAAAYTAARTAVSHPALFLLQMTLFCVHPFRWASVLLGMVCLTLVVTFSHNRPIHWLGAVGRAFHAAWAALLVLLVLAVVAHAVEACYAVHIAQSAGQSAGPWCRQTCLLGYPSLRLLLRLRRAEARTAAHPMLTEP